MMKKTILLLLPDVVCALLSIIVASFILTRWSFAFYIILLVDVLLFAFDFYVFMKASRRPVNLYLLGFLAGFSFSLAIFLIEVSRNWQWDFLIAFSCAYVVALLLKLDQKVFSK